MNSQHGCSPRITDLQPGLFKPKVSLILNQIEMVIYTPCRSCRLAELGLKEWVCLDDPAFPTEAKDGLYAVLEHARLSMEEFHKVTSLNYATHGLYTY